MASPPETPAHPPVHALEWLAVCAGIKPVSRHLLALSEQAAVEFAARRDDLVTQYLWSEAYLRGFRTRTGDAHAGVVFVGKSAAAVARAAVAEERTMALRDRCWLHGGPRARAPAAIELGAALGYPACCTEFFARHGLRESNAQLRARALRATDGPIDWRLHNTDFAQSLISHFVCSYRCSASISLADALLDALRREHPEEATRLVGVLQATLPALVDRLDGRSPAGQTPPEPVQ